MKKEFEIFDGDVKVSYQASPRNNKMIADKIIEWCIKYNVSCGECLIQSDDPTIEAPVLISEIIDDILKFDSDEND